MRYYSTQRPVAPGNYPKPEGNPVLEIVNFDHRIHCEEVDREAWGYIKYEYPLTKSEAKRWELVPEKPLWYPITVCSQNHGGGLVVIAGNAVRAERRPVDVAGKTEKIHCKTRYFSTLVEARRVIKVLKSLSITTERVRLSATQGEVRVLINGIHILNYGDTIVLPGSNADPEDYYGDDVGGWRSSQPDSSFVLGLLWHPLDHVYRYSNLVCQKLGIRSDEWIEDNNLKREF